jgi:hypothetical protein
MLLDMALTMLRLGLEFEVSFLSCNRGHFSVLPWLGGVNSNEGHIQTPWDNFTEFIRPLGLSHWIQLSEVLPY